MKRLFILMFCIVLLTGSINAFEFDNGIKYGNNDLTALIENGYWFGFGEWFGLNEDLGNATLKSHIKVNDINRVGLGDQLVLSYETNFRDIYMDGIGDVEFIDRNTKEKINRDYYWVKIIPSYCEDRNYINGSFGEECFKETYEKLESRDIPKGKFNLGVVVNVEKGDYIDGVVEFAGKKLLKHAEWVEGTFYDRWTLTGLNGDPTGVAVNSTRVAVCDDVDDEVYIYDWFGDFKYSFDTSASGNQHCQGIMWNGTHWATGDLNDFLAYYYAPDGTFVRSVAMTSMGAGIRGMGGNSSEIAWNDLVNDQEFINDANGNVIRDWDLAGEGQNDAEGTAYCFEWLCIVDAGTNKLTRWTMDGTLVATINLNSTHTIPRGLGFFSNSSVESYYFSADTAGDEMFVYQGPFQNVTPIITLNSPIDFFNSSSNSITFNGSVISSLGITNVTLIINGINNETNSSGLNNTNYIFTRTVLDGNYNWTYESCNAFGCTTATERFFTIDTTAPIIDVTFPNETIIFHKKDTNLSLNWTVSDTLSELSSCWFNYNSINTTVTCSDNTTNFNITTILVKQLTFFANDTLNNIANQTVSWDYQLFLNSETFDAEIIEGIETTFSINILTNGSAITSANLRYNNTDNSGSIANPTTNNFTLSKIITSPSVNTKTNISFFWNISQGSLTHSLDVQNQTVLDLSIDDCSGNSNLIYNFTIMDEENKQILNGVSLNTIGKINFKLLNPQSVLITEFSNEFTQTNPFNICLSSNLSEISVNLIHDFEIQYSADGFQIEIYNVQNETINSSLLNQRVSLLDLNSSDAQVFKIIFRDSAFLPVENALIKIKRRYIDEGIFNITEIPKTDERGETVASFVINNVIYKIEVIKFGKTLLTINNVIAKCQTPLVSQCIIDLNAFSDTITLPDFETVDNFNFTISYNNDTRTISSSFLILNGNVQTVSLNVTKQDALGTSVCSDISISSSGTLSCIVPSSFGNSTITVKLFVEGDLKGTGSIKQNQNPLDIYGATLTGLGIFIMLSLIGTSISNNPIFTTVFLMLGVVMLFALNLVANNGFIGSTATILWIIIAIILLLIKGARRN